jgi:poly(A) polymerase Pap1
MQAKYAYTPIIKFKLEGISIDMLIVFYAD